jgi:hypothetical protein
MAHRYLVSYVVLAPPALNFGGLVVETSDPIAQPCHLKHVAEALHAAAVPSGTAASLTILGVTPLAAVDSPVLQGSVKVVGVPPPSGVDGTNVRPFGGRGKLLGDRP